MAGADLGDARLSRRLGQIVAAIARQPGKSLPKALPGPAALEATYRFMSNEAVTPEQILAPHAAATGERCVGRCILAIQDTTECVFPGATLRDGLGWLTGKRQGFRAHVTLAVDADDGDPLGVLDAHTWVRDGVAPGRKKRATFAFKTRPTKESDRWCEAVDRIATVLDPSTWVIHVMDREADFYRLEAQLVESGDDFVIRGSHLERRLADGRTLEEATDAVTVQFTSEVEVSERTPKRRVETQRARKPGAVRKMRKAKLRAGATTIAVKRSWATLSEGATEFGLNVVHVWEPHPPAGQAPVEWTLLTTLATTTVDEIQRVVDIYRKRWLIEELFKSLKTGCQYQTLQLETGDALRNAFAVMLPVAVGLLRLRYLARAAADRRATDVLTPLQCRLLDKHPLTKDLPLETAADALLAVARLGGHIRHNGDPGWLVLGRGYQDLVALEEGAKIYMEM